MAKSATSVVEILGTEMAETVLRNSEHSCSFSAYPNSNDAFEYDSWSNFIDEFGTYVVLI